MIGPPDTTGPKWMVRQAYLQKEACGGFQAVTIGPGNEEKKTNIYFAFCDEDGKMLYKCKKL
jgi:hypothetical protein